jgi:hypothetical protein
LQVIENNKGSSGRARTYNPPVNSDAGKFKNNGLFSESYRLVGFSTGAAVQLFSSFAVIEYQ